MTVYVYDERGHALFTKSLASKPRDGLLGYTSSTVSIRRVDTIYTYDDKGRTLSTKSVI
jgi:hypothetical protein